MKKILCLILALVLSASLFVGCGSKHNEIHTPPTTEAPLETPTDAPVAEDPSAVEPIDPNDYIVDAQDVNGMTVPEYLHIPQFTVDSEDARRINAEILEAFSSTVEWALECEANEDDDYYHYAGSITWKTVDSGSSRLALVIQEEDSMGKGTSGYTVYNFNVATGKQITKEDILKEIGLTADQFHTLVRNYALAEYISIYKDFYSSDDDLVMSYHILDGAIAYMYVMEEGYEKEAIEAHIQPYYEADGTLWVAAKIPVVAGGGAMGLFPLF